MNGKRAAAYTTENGPFAVKLSGLMTKHGENQKTLASVLNVKQQTISYYKNGQSTPDVDNLVKIANHYGVTTDYLLGLTNVPTNDIELKAICEYTGLSCNAINGMKAYKQLDEYAGLNILDFVLTNKWFFSLISHLFNVSQSCGSDVNGNSLGEAQGLINVSSLEKYVNGIDTTEMKRVYGNGAFVLTAKKFREYSAYMAQVALTHLIENIEKLCNESEGAANVNNK